MMRIVEDANLPMGMVLSFADYFPSPHAANFGSKTGGGNYSMVFTNRLNADLTLVMPTPWVVWGISRYHRDLGMVFLNSSHTDLSNENAFPRF